MSSAFWWRLEILFSRLLNWVHAKRVEATKRYMEN